MTSIFVAKLDFNVTNDELKDTFQRFGTVLKATVALDKETGKSRGFGFVEMQNADEAKKAIEALDGFKFNGRPIAVKEAEQRGGNDNRKPFSQDRNQAPRNDQNFRKSEPRVKNDEDELPFRKKEDIVSIDPILPLKTDRSKTKAFKDAEPKKANDKDMGKKSTKMDAYKKSGKNNIFIDDEDDEDLDLFGRSQEEEDEDDYRKYLVNSDEDEDEWEDDDEEWDDEDEDEDEN